jgi:cellulose synthase/poly-beta-1,6-N-acetylglucosamine synthase-like glycosyltransferase
MEQGQPSCDLPRIAVVIIGRNEGVRLKRCLESVEAMQYPLPLLDIIYVDSRSTDKSVELARGMGVETVVLDGPTTAARGRNAGWTRTSAPFVLFLDGDTILDPGFVRSALVELNDPKVAGVWGNRREIDCAGSIYNALFDLEWNAPTGPTLYFGGDALVRLEALQAVSGYNSNLIAGEEPDMCRRMRALGYRIIHINVPMTLHDLDMHHFQQYWRRSFRTGYAYAQISSMYAKTDDPLWLDKSRKNLVRGIAWALFPVVALAASFLAKSVLPFLLFVLLATLLIGRTIWNARSKTALWDRRLAYGLHSQLQHIPILLGQIRFWMLKGGRAKSGLIEYKTAP